MSKTGTSLEHALNERSRDIFVGRSRELALLIETERAARRNPTVAYVHGPAFIGKTALVRRFLRGVSQSAVRLYLDMEPANGKAEAALSLVAQALPGSRTSAAEVVSRINAAAGRGGVTLVLDNYDALGPCEQWFREGILHHVHPGTTLVLAGRTSPARLWPLNRVWRSFIREVRLGEFGPEDAEELMRQYGVHDPVILEDALDIAHGRPQLLMIAADALLEGFAPPTDPIGPLPERIEATAQLLQRVLHPGSSRLTWRAGQDRWEAEEAEAAVSLLPFFDREVLAAMIGRKTMELAWPSLMKLPGVWTSHGQCYLPTSLKHRLCVVTREMRPWASMAWRWRAIRHYVATRPFPLAWEALSALAWESRWHRELSVPATVTGSLREAEAPFDPSGRRPFGESRIQSANASVLSGDLGGEMEAVIWVVPVVPEDGSPTDLPSGPGVLWVPSGAPACMGPLLRLAVGRLTKERWIRVVCPEGECPPDETFTALGFAPDPMPSGWHIQLTGGPANWLERLATPAEDPPPERRWRYLAKEGLQAINDPTRVLTTTAGQYYRKMAGGEVDGFRVRAWLLDALRSTDLGEITCSGATLLSLYYLDRLGPHENVAEYLDLPRTTYFRLHNQALDRLGCALFGVMKG